MAERIRFELTATDRTKTAFNGVKRGLDRMKKSVFSLKGAFVGLLSVAVAGRIFRSLLGGALPFNRAIAETSTLVEGSKQQLDFLRDTARKMASEFGGTGATQVEAFYQAISAGGGTVEEAGKLIQVANKLAIGGVGSLTASVKVLTTALNNYGDAGLTAQDAADILFTGVKFGETTISKLGEAIGRTASLAKDAGVSFTELVAATAALTTTGITTKEAITGIRGILASVIKPTEEARKMAKKLGLEFNVSALKTKGFVKFLDDLVVATGGNVEQLGQLFGGMEALAPIISLTGAVAEKFSATMVGMAERAGEMEEAYLKVATSLEQRLVVQMGRFGVASEIAGSGILTILVPALELVTSNLKLLGGALGFLIATQIPLAIRLFGALLKAIMGIGVAAGTAATGLALLGGPLGIILGISAAVIIFFDDLKEALFNLIPALEDADGLLMRFFATLSDGNKTIREFLGLSFEGELAKKIARLTEIQDTLAAASAGTLFRPLGKRSIRDLNDEASRLQERIRELGEQKIALDAAGAGAGAGVGGGGGVGGGDITSGFSFGKALDALDREAAALDLRTALVGKSTHAAAAFRAEMQILARLQRENIELTPEQSLLIKQFADDVGFSAEMLDKSNTAFEASNKLIADQKRALERANAEVRRIGESFIEMALNGQASFKTMVDVIISEFIRMETRILASKLFGEQSGKGGGGIFGQLLSFAGIALGAYLGGGTGAATAAAGTSVTGTSSVASFAHGGSFTVGGSPGIDNNLVQFKASRGERVEITSASDVGKASGGGTVNTFYIDASGADPAAIARLELGLVEAFGNGRFETRAVSAVVNARRKNPRMFGG